MKYKINHILNNYHKQNNVFDFYFIYIKIINIIFQQI
jgi:hypothetical protein